MNQLKELLGEHQDGLSENDRHHPGVIDAQGHEGLAAGVNFTTNGSLGVLDRHFALRLSYRNDPANDPGHKQHQSKAVADVELSLKSTCGTEHVLERNYRLREAR